MKLVNKLNFYKKINLFQYIYLNYFSKNVIRKGKGKIIPYKNTIIDLEKDSQITLGDKELEIGANKLRKSKTETYIRLRSNAVWEVSNGAQISYGSTIEVLNQASLKTSYFTMNSFSTIICAKSITIGENVMIGRNVTIYDSDFHQIIDGSERVISKEVSIGNHVWLATNVTVLKGVHIGDESIVGNNTVVNRDVNERQLVTNRIEQIVRKENVSWKR